MKAPLLLSIIILAGCLSGQQPADGLAAEEATEAEEPEPGPAHAPAPAFSVKPQAYSAMLMGDLRAHDVVVVRQADSMQNISVPAGRNATEIPWLEASREYVLHVQRGGERLWSTRFTTQAAPYAYAPLESAVIRPGAGYSGTGAFLARDATNSSLYMFTCGHCVDGLGDGFRIAVREELDPFPIAVHTIGEAVAMEYGEVEEGGPFEDWALVRIKPEMRDWVNPVSLQIGGPTRTGAPDGLPGGATICQVGNGNLAREVPAIQARCGYLRSGSTQNGSIYGFSRSEAGDSGSPVFGPDGEAIGIHVGSLAGSTVAKEICHILERAALQGFKVRLLHAPGTWQSPAIDGLPIPEDLPFLYGLTQDCP